MKKGINNQIPGAFSLVPLVVPLVLRGDWNCSYICNTLGILELTAQASSSIQRHVYFTGFIHERTDAMYCTIA